MVYSTRKQTERFEDVLMELGALGLLEIEGQKLLQESSELNAAEETQPTEKTWNTVKRNLWRQEQKNRLAKAAEIIRPIFVRAAVVFFAIFLGAGSVLITSAEVREYVYQMVFTVHDRYSEVVIPEVDNAEYQEDPVYNLTYLPDGLWLEEKIESNGKTIYSYSSNDDNLLTISITNINFESQNTFRFDSENADLIESININQSEGLKIIKQGRTQIVWKNSQTYFSVISDLPGETVVKIAEGIHNVEDKIGILISDNAESQQYSKYKITNIPKGFLLIEQKSNGVDTIHVYKSEANFISISATQFTGPDNQVIRFDTEDADSIQPIQINESLGLMVLKQGRTQIVWQDSYAFFSVASDLPSETVIKIAEGIT